MGKSRSSRASSSIASEQSEDDSQSDTKNPKGSVVSVSEGSMPPPRSRLPSESPAKSVRTSNSNKKPPSLASSKVSAASKGLDGKEKEKGKENISKDSELLSERKEGEEEGEGGPEGWTLVSNPSAQPEQTENNKKSSKDFSHAGLSDVLHRVDIESSERPSTKGNHIPPKPTRSVISPPKNLRSKDSQCRGVKTSSKNNGKSDETKVHKAPKLKKRSKSPQDHKHPKLKKRDRSPRNESKKRSISPKMKKRSRSPRRRSSAKKRSSPPNRRGRRAISTNRFGRSRSKRRAKKRSLSRSSSENSDPKDTARVKRKLSNDMRDSLAQRTRFKGFTKKHFIAAADLLVTAGFSVWGKIAKLDEETRKFLREDLRKNQKCTAAQLCLINDIFAHYENEKPSRSSDRGGSKNAKNSKKL